MLERYYRAFRVINLTIICQCKHDCKLKHSDMDKQLLETTKNDEKNVEMLAVIMTA